MLKIVALMLTDMQLLRWMRNNSASQRRSDLDVCPARRSSSQRRSTVECLTRHDVSRMRKNSQNLEAIQSTWVASKMSCRVSVPDVLYGRTATYVFRIRKWKRRIRAIDIWQNTWKWPITALQVWLYSSYYKEGIGGPLGGRISRYTPPVCPTVCPVPTINSKTGNHTTFKLTGEIIHVRSNYESNFEGGPHTVSVCLIL